MHGKVMWMATSVYFYKFYVLTIVFIVLKYNLGIFLYFLKKAFKMLTRNSTKYSIRILFFIENMD